MEAAGIYADTRRRVADLLRPLSEHQLAQPVPACPGWSVKDVAGHLAAVAADVGAGRIDGPGTAAWIARQVKERRSRPMAEVLQEWDLRGTEVEALLPEMGRAAAPLVVHLVTSEHDLRGALAMPGARASAGVDFALQTVVASLGDRIRRRRLGALRLHAGQDEWIVGTGEPEATVTADRFELVRALVGRRSIEQVGAFGWEGDAAPYVALFPGLPAAVVDLGE